MKCYGFHQIEQDFTIGPAHKQPYLKTRSL